VIVVTRLQQTAMCNTFVTVNLVRTIKLSMWWSCLCH